MKKRIMSLWLALALCLGLATPAAADLLEQSDAFYVADYADVLSADLEEDIYWTNYEELYKYCDGAEIVVVTVNNTGGMNTEDYCYKVFSEWGIGGEKNNGVLILLSIFDKKYFTMVGKNLLNDLDADVLYKFQAAGFEEAFDRGDYESAVEQMFQNCLDVLRTKFSANYDGVITDGGSANDTPWLVTLLGGLLIMILAFVIFASVINAINKSAAVKQGTASPGSSPLLWWMLGRNSARDTHIHVHTPPRPRGTTGYTNSRGGGGMGGGGSFGAGTKRTGSSTSARSSFSGSFRGSSGGRGFGGGRMGGGGGRSFGGGAGRR